MRAKEYLSLHATSSIQQIIAIDAGEYLHVSTEDENSSKLKILFTYLFSEITATNLQLSFFTSSP